MPLTEALLILLEFNVTLLTLNVAIIMLGVGFDSGDGPAP